MSTPWKIRHAVASDHPAVNVLFDELDAFHRERLSWMFRSPEQPPRPEAYYSELLKDPEAALLVAETDRIVGATVVILREAPDFPIFIPQRWAVVDGLTVEPTHRRQGVGRALMGAAEAWAGRTDAKWLELAVYEFNAEARAFYEALGYLPLTTKLRKPLG